MSAPLAEPWRGETYHGRPALKPAGFDAKVGAYVALIGMAGAAQVVAGLARVADGADSAGLARRARWLALCGAAVAPAVLVFHLKTPERFLNMLRIVRPGSPMSWGSWGLVGFGAASAAAAGAGALGWRRAADAAQLPASLLGAGMATYTSALLSATANPLWSAAPAPMAAQAGASAVASGAAALALWQRACGEAESARRLENLSSLALGAEAVFTARVQSGWRREGVSAPMARGATGIANQLGAKALGLAAPFALRALGRPALASAAVLLGGFVLRQALLRAGDRSARRPLDSLGVARR